MPAKVRVPTADGIGRERLDRLLAGEPRRLTLVVAPAGSGKTTLLAGHARSAAGAGIPVAWYRAESWESGEAALLRHLEASLAAAVPDLAAGWGSVEEAVAALEAGSMTRAVLIVDDLHALEGTAAEAALGRFVDYAPPWLSILAGTRVVPGFNLSRLRVSNELLEIGSDDLRFRAWEVERLFREFYGDPVPPGELAVMARRTEGWAAGLQLFHLATRGKSAEERRRILGGVGSSSRLVRDYLTRNVLSELPDELRSFLLGTFVLGRLTGDLCDRLLGARGSARLLEELVRRQIFTVAVDDEDASYRYHEVLRAHLDRIVVDEVGEEEARQRFARAGALLEAEGAVAEALGAYSRAEDWTSLRRLLGGQGERLAIGPSAWLDTLPPAIVRHDPWLTLATARRARAEGRWAAAIDAYGQAEAAFGEARTALVCRRERGTVAAWLDPVVIPSTDWCGAVRSGLVRDPASAGREADGLPAVQAGLVRGVLALAAGDALAARRELARVADDPAAGPALGPAAGIGAGVAALLAGDPAGLAILDAAAEAAERAGLSWLGRLGRAVSRLAGEGAADQARIAGGTSAEADPWGAALDQLLDAWQPASSGSAARGEAATRAEGRQAAAERAATSFRRLGSGVLEAWSRSLAALAIAELGSPEARDAALAAETIARTSGTGGARLIAYRALAAADPARAADYDLLGEAIRTDTGLAGPPAASPAPTLAKPNGSTNRPTNGHAVAPATTARADAGAIAIRTLGGFAIEANGVPVPVGQVKPRARALLRFLALQAGGAVHREVICEALWPDADAATGSRSLHVALSSVRGMLTTALGPDGGRLIEREGDAYRLAVSAEDVDLGRFERAVAEGRAARARGDAAAAFATALELHGGELLPEDGPAEWVVERREQVRADAVEAARALAEDALLRGDHDAAVRACRAGLRIDRYHDPLWRLLIEARDRAGDAGAAARDRREYEQVLAGLGLDQGVPVSPS